MTHRAVHNSEPGRQLPNMTSKMPTWMVMIHWPDVDGPQPEFYGPFNSRDERDEWVRKADRDPRYFDAHFLLANIDPPHAVLFAEDDEHTPAPDNLRHFPEQRNGQ